MTSTSDTSAAPEDTLLTVPEAAQLLRVHESTVRRLVRSGGLPGLRVGRQWRVDRDGLAAPTRSQRHA